MKMCHNFSLLTFQNILFFCNKRTIYIYIYIYIYTVSPNMSMCSFCLEIGGP